MDEVEKENIKQNVLKSTLQEVKATTAETDGHLDPCVICLDSISERAVVSPCRHHNFDFLCLVSWLQERPTCPLCKSEVRSVEYDWESPENFKVYKVTPNVQQSSSAGVPRFPRTAIPNYNSRRRPRADWTRQRHRLQPPVDTNSALLRRRHVYRHQLYSLHVGSNRLSRFRDLTPQLFSRDEELISRARKWIRRELQVFEFLNADGSGEEGVTRRANNAEFLLEYIVAILKTVDIKGSGGQSEDMLQEFLGRDNTRLFLHELRAWLRSPFLSLEDWDRHVQYCEPPSTMPQHKVQQPTGLQELGTPEEQQRRAIPSRQKAPIERFKQIRHDRYVPYHVHHDPRINGRYRSDPG